MKELLILINACTIDSTALKIIIKGTISVQSQLYSF